MNILEHFEHHGRKHEKEHFMHLIQIALADGTIKDSEMAMLQRFGRKYGFSEQDVENLIELTKQSAFVPPYELSERFEQFFEIVKMVLADGKIDNSEMRLATNFALKSGFTESEIPGLLNLLIIGIKNGTAEEDLFYAYKKKRMAL